MSRLTIRTEATKDQVFALLTDYERYFEWAPDVTEVTLLADEGDIAIVEFRSPELMPETYQLEFVQTKPTTLAFKQQGIYQENGRPDHGLHGSWHLMDGPDGQSTIVTATMSRKTTVWQGRDNRRQSHLVLQRRLDAIQQLFSPTSAMPYGGLTDCQDQQIRHQAAMITGLPTASLELRFHDARPGRRQ